MAHHDDLLHLKDRDGEFQRGRNAMAAAAELQRRHEVGDVANREYLAGCGVEDGGGIGPAVGRSEEHTSELQSLMRNSYAVICLKQKPQQRKTKPLTNDR